MPKGGLTKERNLCELVGRYGIVFVHRVLELQR